MTFIVIGIISAFILFIRSIESVTTNSQMGDILKNYHKSFKNYVSEIINSNFETASKGVFLKTTSIGIYFLAGVLLLYSFVYGAYNSIKGVELKSIYTDTLILLTTFLFIRTIQFGLNFDFGKIRVQIKKEILSIIKSPKTWGLIILFYLLMTLCIYIISNSFNFTFGKTLELFIVDINFLKLLIIPFLGLISILLIVTIGITLIWGLSRLTAITSYFLVKKILLYCEICNEDEPLKPFALIVQILIALLAPIFALFMK